MGRDPVPLPERARGLCLAALLSVLALAPAPALAEGVDAKARRDLERTETELRQSRTAAEAARQARQAAEAEIEQLREQLVTAAERLQAEEGDLAEIQQRLHDLAAEEARHRESLGRQSQALQETLAVLSRLARRSPTAMLTGSGPPLQVYRGVRLVAAVSGGLLDRTKALRTELTALAELRQEIEREQRLRQARIAEMTERRGALARLFEEKRRLEQKLEVRSREAQGEVDRLAQEASDLHQLLDRLAEAEARRRREAAEQAEAERRAEAARLAEAARRQEQARREASAAADSQAESEDAEAGAETSLVRTAALTVPPLPAHKPGPEATTVVVNAAAQQRLPAPSLFSEARGKLPMPARGRVVVGFGAVDDQGQKSRGITIETVELAQVTTPFDGEIVFAGPFRGYGLLLIISLGEGYHILLSGMSRLYGVVGQQVLAGEPVGEMGTVEAQGPRLYVELRRRGEPINPRPWMSAAKGKISG